MAVKETTAISLRLHLREISPTTIDPVANPLLCSHSALNWRQFFFIMENYLPNFIVNGGRNIHKISRNAMKLINLDYAFYFVNRGTSFVNEFIGNAYNLYKFVYNLTNSNFFKISLIIKRERGFLTNLFFFTLQNQMLNEKILHKKLFFLFLSL